MASGLVVLIELFLELKLCVVFDVDVVCDDLAENWQELLEKLSFVLLREEKFGFFEFQADGGVVVVTENLSFDDLDVLCLRYLHSYIVGRTKQAAFVTLPFLAQSRIFPV